ncbi:MAG: PhoH family protein [Clostridiales bacterium]|nr:PhoH family protein [Clostridiales bacterium]
MLETLCGVTVRTTSDGVEINGKNTELAELLLDKLISALGRGEEINPDTVRRYYNILGEDPDGVDSISARPICVNAHGQKIYPKTVMQKRFADAVENHLLTFAIGPAGTGKTYLAVAMAANAVKKGTADKIILTRPAIEAGEKLGFLPGDLQMKVDPYLKPLYDALGEMFGADYTKLIERGTVEIAPLAYMRGRTLSHAFIILDEAQNTTPEQMKMFLTRFGEGSRAIVTGDITQIDLRGETSGLTEAEQVLSGVEGIAFVHLSEEDVVRHGLVMRIVKAYNNYNNRICGNKAADMTQRRSHARTGKTD